MWPSVVDVSRRAMNVSAQSGANDTGDPNEPVYFGLVLAVIPLCCIAGNLLVILSVMTERSLQNTTNYLLMSLACADLLVGCLVMPFSVYLAVQNLEWYLGRVVCNLFCVMDVAGSTSSIVHLVAISMDRFFAVVRHTEYKTQKHRRRVHVTIASAWVFSLLMGLPLGIGLNHGKATDEALLDNHCGIINPSYMLYSSIFSFYIPCIVMGIMYSFVFYRLRQRLRVVELQEMAAGQMVNFGDNIGNILANAYGTKDNGSDGKPALTWAMPFLRRIEATLGDDADSLSSEEFDELNDIFYNLENDRRRQTEQQLLNASQRSQVSEAGSLRRQRPSQAGRRLTGQGHAGHGIRRLSTGLDKLTRKGSRRKSMYKAKEKVMSLKERAVTLLMKLKSKQGIAIRKETRATKLVVTVLVTFLICWLPFFTLNVVKVAMLFEGSWTPDLEVGFVFVTWLGYLNSCLNPIIYTSINRKFRASFRRILLCRPRRGRPGYRGRDMQGNGPRRKRGGNLDLESPMEATAGGAVEEEPAEETALVPLTSRPLPVSHLRSPDQGYATAETSHMAENSSVLPPKPPLPTDDSRTQLLPSPDPDGIEPQRSPAVSMGLPVSASTNSAFTASPLLERLAVNPSAVSINVDEPSPRMRRSVDGFGKREVTVELRLPEKTVSCGDFQGSVLRPRGARFRGPETICLLTFDADQGDLML